MSEKLQPRIAVYAGSFDPLTLGHLDIIQRGAKIFHRLVVGVGINPDKAALFSVEERLELITSSVTEHKNVSVKSFEGLTVNFAERCARQSCCAACGRCPIWKRNSRCRWRTALWPEIETMFLMASEKYSHISSTLIKQIAKMGAEANFERLRKFVPEPVIAPLMSKFGHVRRES